MFGTEDLDKAELWILVLISWEFEDHNDERDVECAENNQQLFIWIDEKAYSTLERIILFKKPVELGQWLLKTEIIATIHMQILQPTNIKL